MYQRIVAETHEYYGEKTGTRALQVKKLMLYHTSRQFTETSWKLQGDIENLIIDEVVEWSMSSYTTGVHSYSSHLVFFIRLIAVIVRM